MTISRGDSLLPYQGQEPYIFLSYAHADSEEALPIVEGLQSEGYRVWYDEGIDPGTEWDENIAAHVEACGYFIALLSQNYLKSSNCKDELNYARELEKPRLIVYLEDVELPGGMRMRLGRLQAIYKSRYQDEGVFFEKLFSASGMDRCRALGTPDPRAAYTHSAPRKVPSSVSQSELTCVYDLAREYGMTSKEMLIRLRDLGIRVSSPLSKLDDATASIVRSNLDRDAADGRPAHSATDEEPVRVFDLARECGVTSKEMLLRIRSMGITVAYPSLTVDASSAAIVRRRLKHELADGAQTRGAAAKARMRVSDLAREYGMTSKEMIELLQAMKIPAKSPSSMLEEAYVALVRKRL